MNQEMYLLTKRLVEIPSVNSTEGEAAIGEFIENYIRSIPYFAANPELVEARELKGDALGRRNVLALLKGGDGTYKDTIILHGHTDTVGVDDFGRLKELAFSPDALMEAFWDTTLPEEVRRDLESGNYLFGRGACDMKSGDAAFLVLLKELAENKDSLRGNILVSFNPVEENSHTGMIEALTILEEWRDTHRLDYRLAVNNDYTCPLFPGDENRYIYTGVGGKLLPCFYIQGKETHVGQCFEGLDPTLVASELVKEFAYNPKYSDLDLGAATMPPTVLCQRDLKPWYNVQTAEAAWVYLNYFVHGKTVPEIVQVLKEGAEEAIKRGLSTMEERYQAFTRMEGRWASALKWQMPVMEFKELEEYGRNHILDFEEKYLEIKNSLPLEKREAGREIIAWILRESGYKDPVVVLYFAAPYCPHNTLRDDTLMKLIKDAASRTEQEHETIIELLPYFPSLSDSSYLAIEDKEESIACLQSNFPAMDILYPLPFDIMKKLAIPAVNFGVYGKDAHKWTERVDMAYSFGVLPDLIRHTIEKLFSKEDL